MKNIKIHNVDGKLEATIKLVDNKIIVDDPYWQKFIDKAPNLPSDPVERFNRIPERFSYLSRIIFSGVQDE
jgi:pyruvate carboxylase